MIEFNNSTEPERGAIVPLLFYGGLAVTGLLLSQCAFTKKVRREIVERDGSCQWDDPYTMHEGRLEAAHYDHSRSNPDYNNAKNGRLLCTAHHIEDHIEREGQNGLPEYQNQWSIGMMLKRLFGD